MTSYSSWSDWLAPAAAAVEAIKGRVVKFPAAGGEVLVVFKEGMLPHLTGSCSRARCRDNTATEFDLRRLQACPQSGTSGSRSFVPFAKVQAVEREVELMTAVGEHPHIVSCYASLVDNVGPSHTRLLLCDPCMDSLSGHLNTHSKASPVVATETIGICDHIIHGLEHLHRHHILCGRIAPAGVLLGCDGLWKLGDFRHAARLPLTTAQWREQCVARPEDDTKGQPCIPPEARSCVDGALSLIADVWLLGYMLAGLLIWCRPGAAILQQRGAIGDTLIVATLETLLDPLEARLWLLFHGMLASEPTQRPSVQELCALVGSLEDVAAEDLLKMLPASGRFHCNSSVLGAVRRVAVNQVMAESQNPAHRSSQLMTGATLRDLRERLLDPADIDSMCANCGVNLDWVPTLVGDGFQGKGLDRQVDAPQLVALGNDLLVSTDGLKIPARSIGSLSTDAGSASESDSICSRALTPSLENSQGFDEEDCSSVSDVDSQTGPAPRLLDLSALAVHELSGCEEAAVPCEDASGGADDKKQK